MAPLLDVRDLTIAFPSATPVRNLSFSLAPAETLAIVGESGSGKSLTALALMRLLPGTARIVSGRVRLRDDELLVLPEIEMRRRRGRDIAMIFQEPMTSLNPVLTIGRQITEVLQVHRGLSKAQARREAAELLDLVRIPNPERCLDDHPHRLSGGMRQRVMIAIALACDPDLLIADEPTTALDVTVQAEIIELMRNLCAERGTAILMISHDLGLVANVCRRVGVMYAGRIVEERRSDDIFRAGAHPYTQGLVDSLPRLGSRAALGRARLREIAGVVPAIADFPAGCRFNPRCALATEICRTTVPETTWLDAGGLVRCHHHA